MEMVEVGSRLCATTTEDLYETFSVITKILNMKQYHH